MLQRIAARVPSRFTVPVTGQVKIMSLFYIEFLHFAIIVSYFERSVCYVFFLCPIGWALLFLFVLLNISPICFVWISTQVLNIAICLFLSVDSAYIEFSKCSEICFSVHSSRPFQGGFVCHNLRLSFLKWQSFHHFIVFLRLRLESLSSDWQR